MGFGVWGLGFGVWGLGFGGLGFGVWGLGFGVWGLGFGVWGLGFRVYFVLGRGLVPPPTPHQDGGAAVCIDDGRPLGGRSLGLGFVVWCSGLGFRV